MADGEAWKRMVLTAAPPPAWLAADAPSGDVVLSTRFRLARNLVGFRFVHAASDPELRHAMETVLAAAREANLGYEVHKGLTHAERDHLVATRLVSSDYEWTLPGRALLIDPDRAVSVMINEEDHLRYRPWWQDGRPTPPSARHGDASTGWGVRWTTPSRPTTAI
jgi:protein arginine kinase